MRREMNMCNVVKIKNIALIFFFFCFCSVSTAELSNKLTFEGQLSAGRKYACALDEDGVKCWEWYSGSKIDVPVLKKPRQVSAGGNHTCALDDEGVKCWRASDGSKTDVPVLKNPGQVSAGFDHTCAIDGGGVKCWGWNHYGQTNLPGLKNPRQVSVGYNHFCALDDEGVKCWGWYSGTKTNVPVLKNPRQVSAGDDHTCALDDEGVKCWEWYSGSKIDVPVLKNPRQVSANYIYTTCALDDEGVKCWPSNSDGQTNVPVLIYFSYYLNLVIDSSVYSKSTFLKALSGSELDFITDLNERRPLLISIVSPAVLGTDSQYFKDVVIPEWNFYVTFLKKKINLPLNQDPLLAIEATLENRTLALKAIQSSLDVSLNFLSGKQIDRTQDALRKVGQAMIDEMNNQIVLEALNSVESLKEERGVLLSSDKSKFLIECQQVAIDWLKLKVK